MHCAHKINFSNWKKWFGILNLKNMIGVSHRVFNHICSSLFRFNHFFNWIAFINRSINLEIHILLDPERMLSDAKGSIRMTLFAYSLLLFVSHKIAPCPSVPQSVHRNPRTTLEPPGTHPGPTHPLTRRPNSKNTPAHPHSQKLTRTPTQPKHTRTCPSAF